MPPSTPPSTPAEVLSTPPYTFTVIETDRHVGYEYKFEPQTTQAASMTELIINCMDRRWLDLRIADLILREPRPPLQDEQEEWDILVEHIYEEVTGGETETERDVSDLSVTFQVLFEMREHHLTETQNVSMNNFRTYDVRQASMRESALAVESPSVEEDNDGRR